MAVPDDKIGEVSNFVVPMMEKDAVMILLDVATAYVWDVSLRSDCTFIIVHPCHPRFFQEQETSEAYRDFFGGIAKQDTVIALLQGKEENLKVAEKTCREVFAPVINCHLSVDQIAVPEPIASEIVVNAASYLMKEALNEAVKLGVPEDATRLFLLGHIRILLAVLFGESSHKISKATENAIKYGYYRILKTDWREVFNYKE